MILIIPGHLTLCSFSCDSEKNIIIFVCWSIWVYWVYWIRIVQHTGYCIFLTKKIYIYIYCVCESAEVWLGITTTKIGKKVGWPYFKISIYSLDILLDIISYNLTNGRTDGIRIWIYNRIQWPVIIVKVIKLVTETTQ